MTQEVKDYQVQVQMLSRKIQQIGRQVKQERRGPHQEEGEEKETGINKVETAETEVETTRTILTNERREDPNKDEGNDGKVKLTSAIKEQVVEESERRKRNI